ncbi:MAG: hypothetical protein M1527_05440 [Gammaproteobacteria bacterium]|nr:hypothetical protein [Gammaproteobacteria bacterium]
MQLAVDLVQPFAGARDLLLHVAQFVAHRAALAFGVHQALAQGFDTGAQLVKIGLPRFV